VRSKPLPLSALDVSPIPSGSTAADALKNTVDLAQHVERLGFRRYWVAEHHNAGSLASSAPEIMIGQIAAATKTIRVGAGGIMLPNHSPLKVAELFRVLHTLFPERIDLGLGRAAGTDPRTASALRRAAQLRSADDFPEQMNELLSYLEDGAEVREAFARTVRAIPTGVPTPEIWILGSSEYGGAFAAKNGFGFAFAHHINPVDAVKVMQKYRADFQPSHYSQTPYAILGLAAICGANENVANDLRTVAKLGALQFSAGLRDLPIPSFSDAKAYEWDDEDRALAQAFNGRGFIGTKEEIVPPIEKLIEECGADELMIMSNPHDHQQRKESYSLLRDAFAMGVSSVSPSTAT
jgi:luciferase family oxidoreductase group 1